jgi:hypothetical protein
MKLPRKKEVFNFFSAARRCRVHARVAVCGLRRARLPQGRARPSEAARLNLLRLTIFWRHFLAALVKVPATPVAASSPPRPSPRRQLRARLRGRPARVRKRIAAIIANISVARAAKAAAVAARCFQRATRPVVRGTRMALLQARARPKLTPDVVCQMSLSLAQPARCPWRSPGW